jgi:epoxyqueuosine reductase
MREGLKQAIRDEAERLGFVACGFAPADAVPEAGERLREWLAQGRHGTMGWMEERAGQRAHPQALWPEAKSVIALAMGYAPAEDPRRLATRPRSVGSAFMRRAATITRRSRRR